MEDEFHGRAIFIALLCCLTVAAIILGMAGLTLGDALNSDAPDGPKIVTAKISPQPAKLLPPEPVVRKMHRSTSALVLKKKRLFRSIIHQAASRHQVDPALVKAIIMAESGYNPKAISRRGAVGLMQLMPATAEALGVEDSFNPEHNIEGGVRYFRQLINRFDGDVTLALAAYNAGVTTVRTYQGIPPFKSTRFYIKKVFKYYHIYKSHSELEADRA